MICVERPIDLAAHLGEAATSPESVTLDRALLEAFIAVSGDDQAIHRGPGAIVPGNLLLALVPRLLKSAVEVRRFDSAMTARIDRVAFRRPARLGETLRLEARLRRVARLRPEGESERVAVAVDCALLTDGAIATLRVTDVYSSL